MLSVLSPHVRHVLETGNVLIDEGFHFNEPPEWTHLEKNLDSHLTPPLTQSGAIAGICYQSPERLSAHAHTPARVCVQSRLLFLYNSLCFSYFAIVYNLQIAVDV